MRAGVFAVASAVDIFHLLPDIAAIGQKQLQVYCDQWLRRPIARQLGVAQLSVNDDLLLSVNLDLERVPLQGDQVFFPIDELLGYIIDQHFSDSEKRRLQHENIREARQRWGELGRDYELAIGRVGRLYLTCKNPACRVELETEHDAFEGQTVECPPCEITCPACGQINEYDGDDLELKL